MLAFASAAFGQDARDVYRLQVFSEPSSRVVAVGDELQFQVQGVAVPENGEAAERLVRALRRIAFPSEVTENFQVIDAAPTTIRRRGGTAIIEFSRLFTLSPTRAGRLAIPAAAIQLDDGLTFDAPPQHVLAYRENEGLANARRNVVALVAEGNVDGRDLRRIGSGFLIADDALVTAYHVVIGSDRVRVHLSNGQTLTTSKVWAIDPVRDVAILRIDPNFAIRAGLKPLALSPDLYQTYSATQDGVVFTAGWPDGIQQYTAGERYRSLRFETRDVLGVSSNGVRPGDSGGPLLNERGEVVGVVSSGRSTGREADALQEDLCLAADPRRAIAERIVRSEPVSLRAGLREAGHEAPNGEVIEAASMLMMPGQARQHPDGYLAQMALAAQRAPNDASLQFLAGSVFQAMGDEARAEAAYTAALNGLSDYFPALYALGDMHYQRGEYDVAEELFGRTRSFAPYARLGALGLARIHTIHLRYTAAAAALREVLVGNPDYAPALYLLGYGHLAEGRILEAEALAVVLDRIDPGWAVALRFQIEAPLLHPPGIRPLPRAEILTNRGDQR